jgi:hypothetical protein
VKVEYLPKMDKIFFMPFERVEGFIEPIYMLLRRMIGRECFVLNNFNLASILAEKWPDEFESLREALPPFSLIFCLSAGERFPEEKIAYEEEAMMEVADQLHFDCLPTVGGIPGLGVRMLKIMRKPWTEEPYWKFRYKGASQDVFFLTTLNRVPDFTHAIVDVSAKYGYASKDIGIYVQPVEYGRACHCRYSFHYDPNDVREKERVHLLFLEASERAISMGGLFITPYGPWADMVYSRVPYTYSAMSKIAKEAFDPNNIMNPGKLCF